MSDFNTGIIQEFRANSGKLGGGFDGVPMLLLHSTGAKSGDERVNPLAYQAVGEGWAVFASKGGSPTNPAWYHNLKAHPETTIEVGAETVPVTATELTGAERDAVFAKQKEAVPAFASYETKTSRTIPVMLLTRR